MDFHQSNLQNPTAQFAAPGAWQQHAPPVQTTVDWGAPPPQPPPPTMRVPPVPVGAPPPEHPSAHSLLPGLASSVGGGAPLHLAGALLNGQLEKEGAAAASFAATAFGTLRKYFTVTNSFVLNRLKVLLFPFRSDFRRIRKSGGAEHELPCNDKNGIDLYVPVMALVTYVMLSAFVKGAVGAFTPEVLGTQFSWSVGVVLLETLLLQIGAMAFAAQGLPFLDSVAFSGYKFFSVCLCLLVRVAVPFHWMWLLAPAWFASCSGFVVRAQVKEMFGDSDGGVRPAAQPFLWACFGWQFPIFLLLLSGLGL